MLKTGPGLGAFVGQKAASDRTGTRSWCPKVLLRSGLAPPLPGSGVTRGLLGLSAGFLSRWVDMTSGGADVDQKIQQMKRVQVQEGDEDCVTKRRKAEVEPGSEDRRYPKKKVALLLAYSGKGYYGMQVPPPAGLPRVLPSVPLGLTGVLPLRGIPGPPSSGPSRTTWWLHSSNQAASPPTMERT